MANDKVPAEVGFAERTLSIGRLRVPVRARYTGSQGPYALGTSDHIMEAMHPLILCTRVKNWDNTVLSSGSDLFCASVVLPSVSRPDSGHTVCVGWAQAFWLRRESKLNKSRGSYLR